MGIRIQTLPVGPLSSNCHLVSDDRGQTLVVDPGDDTEAIWDLLESGGLTVAAYLLTHGHVDHVSAVADLYDRIRAPVAMHPKDAAWAFGPMNVLPPFCPAPRAPSALERELADGQTWQDGDARYRVIATPGHSPGSVCFYFEEDGILLAGDTLFQGSVGRTDLPGGSTADLAASLRRLAELPLDTKVYPGHGPATTIGSERRANPFVRDVL